MKKIEFKTKYPKTKHFWRKLCRHLLLFQLWAHSEVLGAHGTCYFKTQRTTGKRSNVTKKLC